MAQIKGFKAIVYNQDKVNNLSKVYCPPYDVISQESQERFYNTHPYNFVRILLNKGVPTDNDKDNRYIRAKTIFEDWLNNSILIQEKEDCIYFYLQEFIFNSCKKKRLGFIALLRLDNEQQKCIFPHENTQAKPKQDRLELLKSVRANLSPIFALFSDEEHVIEDIYQQELSKTESFINVVDDEKTIHQIWRVTNSSIIDRLVRDLRDKHVFIADGHHRYNVAQGFRNYMIQNVGKDIENADYNFIMAYFTNLDCNDLLILPIHRLVKELPEDTTLWERKFSIERVKIDELKQSLAKTKDNEHIFGFYRDKEFQLLRLKSERYLDEIELNSSKVFKSLDVTILKYLILDPLKIMDNDIVYTQDFEEAIKKVDHKEAEAAFILNPVKIKDLKIIALGGECMLPKSTYFYPKVLSGLAVNKFSEDIPTVPSG